MIVIILLFCGQNSWAQRKCHEITREFSIHEKVDFYRNKQRLFEPKEITFLVEGDQPASKMQIESYWVDRKFGNVFSSSQVYLSIDNTFVIKEYAHDSDLAMYDILVTEFYLENNLEVPAIFNYSRNAFAPDKSPIYIVKEYKVGLDITERRELGIKFNEEYHLKKEQFSRAFSGFKKWVKKHKYGDIYMKRNSKSAWTLDGDFNEPKNWILSADGWILIDP